MIEHPSCSATSMLAPTSWREKIRARSSSLTGTELRDTFCERSTLTRSNGGGKRRGGQDCVLITHECSSVAPLQIKRWWISSTRLLLPRRALGRNTRLIYT